MARPRKNRIGEYASLLADEMSYHVGRDLLKALVETQEAGRREVSELRAEVETLQRQLQSLARKLKPEKSKERLGRWVPGGPGRPPKDAEERIAAFTARHKGDEEGAAG